jgi:hypothetical protein
MYRKQYKTEEDVEITNLKNIFEYILIKEEDLSYNKAEHVCKMCKRKSIYPRGNPGNLCIPKKRLLLSGKLWYKKFCPIDGYHVHYQCASCYLHSVLMLPEIKLNQIAMV